MGLLDLTIVAVTLIGLVIFAGYLAKRQRDAADYYLGGRSLTAAPLGMSLAANQVSAVSLVGAPAFVALREGGGLLWLQYELAVPLAMALLIVWGVPALRRAPGADVYGAVEERLGRLGRRTVASFFLLGRGLGTGVILYSSALVVDACSGWGVAASLGVVATVAVVYTALGGLVADVFSDVLQLILLWGGTLVAAVVLAWRLSHTPGGLLAGVDPERLVPIDWTGHGLGDGATFAFWPMLIGGLFLYLSYYGCDQTQAQRILAARDQATARRALLIASMVRFPLVLTYCAFGLLLAAWLHAEPTFAAALEGQPADALVPTFLVTYVPTGLLGLVVAGFFAAALSSIDSALNSLSAVTVEEVLGEGGKDGNAGLWRERGMTLAWGVFATAAAAYFASGRGETVIEQINRVGSLLYGPMLAVFLLAWRSRRADGRSAMLGAFSGVAANLALALFAPQVSWLWWNVAGCAVTALAGHVLGRQRRQVSTVESGGRDMASWLLLFFGAVLAALLALGVVL